MLLRRKRIAIWFNLLQKGKIFYSFSVTPPTVLYCSKIGCAHLNPNPWIHLRRARGTASSRPRAIVRPLASPATPPPHNVPRATLPPASPASSPLRTATVKPGFHLPSAISHGKGTVVSLSNNCYPFLVGLSPACILFVCLYCPFGPSSPAHLLFLYFLKSLTKKKFLKSIISF